MAVTNMAAALMAETPDMMAIQATAETPDMVAVQATEEIQETLADPVVGPSMVVEPILPMAEEPTMAG
ncbi:hypothetical protein GCM10007315_33970 [Gemmobacter tilapiae]|uniref:Uncharacterized protein n=1 Tax=Neogemmobacter tilapiae TaxID=875041 RepID=A0A918TWP7_9RHOB|nr:hypothetical protein GCM10007315_33970 [Gemmobacter tilapiae]